MAAAHTPGSRTQQTSDQERLKSWWAGFKRIGKKEQTPAPEAAKGIFGVPLHVSIKYANVAISLMDENGKSFIYGYVPIVVAKCGVFLKEKATDVEGIFRLSGSAKRIKELQTLFDTPTRYGKGLDWTGYTVHDAANVLRRYLNQLPQPIVPLEAYEKFRNPLRDHQAQAVGDTAAQAQDVGNFDVDSTIVTYQRLITEMPPLNRQLLLYVLDLLSVFASKSDVNRMTAANLAAIFQPGLLSHPDHDMKPEEYRLSQDVLIFLIENQDSFLIGMNGTAADEKTVREVQSGTPTPQASTPPRATQAGLGRSASTASASTEGQKRLGGVRRNLSVSSRNSRGSSGPNAPHSPASAQIGSGSSGVYRSNTVPSKKSPALSSRVNRGLESPSTPIALSPALVPPPSNTSPGAKLAPTPTVLEPTSRPVSESESTTPTGRQSGAAANMPFNQENVYDHGKEPLVSQGNSVQAANEPAQATITTGRSRNLSSLLKAPPTSDGKEHRPPNKLKKKRMPSSAQPSASSSTHSLQNGDVSSRQIGQHALFASLSPMTKADPSLPSNSSTSDTATLPTFDIAPRVGEGQVESTGSNTLEAPQQPSEGALKAEANTESVHSKSSVTDHSEHENAIDDKAEQPEKKRTWRFSHSAKKSEQLNQLASPPLIGTNKPAGASSSSIGSWSKARKSVSNDIPPVSLEPVLSESTNSRDKSDVNMFKDMEHAEDAEKKGIFGRLRNRLQHAKDDRKERGAERERAKSPPRAADRNNSKHSLTAIALDLKTSDGNANEVQKDDKPLETDDGPGTSVAVGTMKTAYPTESAQAANKTQAEAKSLVNINAPPVKASDESVSVTGNVATASNGADIQTEARAKPEPVSEGAVKVEEIQNMPVSR